MLSSYRNQSTQSLTSIMPSIVNQLMEDQEYDQGPTENRE
jgi:hypothetical protein